MAVVRQMETAALKAAGSNKSSVFERKVTELYTKGTWMEDFSADDEDASQSQTVGSILCLNEICLSVSDECVEITVILVQPGTGEIVCDTFQDGFLRSELETRLLYLQPCEFVTVGSVSKITLKTINQATIPKSSHDIIGEVRMTSYQDIDVQLASSALIDYTSEFCQADDDLDGVFKSTSEKICCAALIRYLRQFSLERVFDSSRIVERFVGKSNMLLNGNTIASLELFCNQTDSTEYGSLFWILNNTKSKFGRRLLRKWIGRPLLHPGELSLRINAVQEILHGRNARIETLGKVLSKLPDLERGLCRICYGKCSLPELSIIINGFNYVAKQFVVYKSVNDVGFGSPLLNDAFYNFSCIRSEISQIFSKFDDTAAKRDDIFNFFHPNDESEKISELKLSIAAIEGEFEEYLQEVRRVVRSPDVEYVTVAENIYLLEIKSSNSRHIPRDWIKINGTKYNSRYRTPKTITLLAELSQCKEALELEYRKQYSEFLRSISQYYRKLRMTVMHLSVVDCLMSLAIVAARPNYCQPKFVEENCIHIVNGRHPVVEELIDAYVPNDIHFSQNGMRASLITGPNMGGKSSYVKQVALMQIMAQIGSYLPADSATLGIFDSIFTRYGICALLTNIEWEHLMMYLEGKAHSWLNFMKRRR